MNTFYYILLAFSITSTVFAQSDNANLVCYDCEPKDNNTEQCSQPVSSGLAQVNCNQDIPTRDANSTLLCLSAYLTFSGDQVNQTGVYRGCRSQNSSIVNYCDWFKEETETKSQNIVVTSCVPCNSSRCNSVIFNVNGEPNGSSLVQTAFAVLGISLLFVLFF